jgi:hypothetical protein
VNTQESRIKAPGSFDPLGKLSVRIRLARQFAMPLVASDIAGSAGSGAHDGGAINGIASRAQTVADAKQEKAKHLELQEPPRGEQKFDHTQKDILDRIFNAHGWSLKFTELATGGGFSPDHNIRGRICWPIV